MRDMILKLLENDARLTDKQLAIMLDKDEDEIKKEIPYSSITMPPKLSNLQLPGADL